MTDIQQTPGDRLRFEIILKSLSEGGNNLAILSEHDMVLDFYANLIDERLRALDNSEVEFCFSTNSERLVQKFNDILSELTVDEALDKDRSHSKRRYLVFRDSILMQDFELQLLARLVNGFPASNICVILLINSAGSNRHKLDAFGKSLLQWEVETQAGEAKKPLENWVAEEPPAPIEPVLDPVDAAAVLIPPTKPSWRIPGFGRKTPAVAAAAPAAPSVDAMPLPPPPAMPLAEPAASSALANVPEVSREPELWLTPSVDASPEPSEPVDFARPPRRFPWGLLLLVPLVSAAAFGYLYRDLIEEEAEAFKKYLLRGTPAPVAAPAEAASAPQEVASEPTEPEVASTDEKKEDKKEDKAEPASPPASEPAPAATAVAPVVDKPARPAEPMPAVEKAKETAASPKVDAKSDEAWIEQLAATSYVLQLAAFDTEEEIQAFRRSDPAYAKARVLKVRKKDSSKRYYVLVLGPLASKAEADALMQSNPLLGKGWLRTAKSLKAQL
jgi:hypothetical protein